MDSASDGIFCFWWRFTSDVLLGHSVEFGSGFSHRNAFDDVSTQRFLELLQPLRRAFDVLACLLALDAATSINRRLRRRARRDTPTRGLATPAQRGGYLRGATLMCPFALDRRRGLVVHDHSALAVRCFVRLLLVCWLSRPVRDRTYERPAHDRDEG